MKTITSPNLINKQLRIFIVVCCLFLTTTVFSQEESEQEQDSTQAGVSLGRIKMQKLESVSSKYTYDPVTDKYIYTESIGNYDISYPVILTPEEYERLILNEQMRDYFKEKIDAVSGKEGTEEAQKNLLPNFYVNSNFFESVFGGNTIEVIPQGSVAMDLGVRFQKNDNPALSPRNRSNVSFDFDHSGQLFARGSKK